MTRKIDEDIGYASPDTETPNFRIDFDKVTSEAEYDIVASTSNITIGDEFPYSDVKSGLDATKVWRSSPQSGVITSIASANGVSYVGYTDGSVIKIDSQNGDVISTKTVHNNRITDIDINRNGDIATSSVDGRVIKLNNQLEKQWEHSLHDDPSTGNPENASSVSIHKDRVYSGGEQTKVYAVDGATGEQLWAHDLHQDTVTGVSAYTVESVTLDSSAIGDNKDIIRIDSIDVVFSCSNDGFIGAVYARNRQFDNGNVTLSAGDPRWSVNTQNKLNDIDADENIVTVGDNGIIGAYSDWNGDKVYESSSLDSNVLSVEADERDSYVGTSDGTVRANDMAKDSVIWEHTFHEQTARITGVATATNASGQTLVQSTSTDSDIRAVNAETESGIFTKIGSTKSRQVDYNSVGDTDWRFTKGENGTHDLALSPDNEYAYTSTLNGSVISLNRKTGDERWRHSLHGSESSAYGVASIDTNDNTELVVSGGTDNAVRVYNGDTQNELAFHGFHDSSVYSVSAEGKDIYSVDSVGTLHAVTLDGDILSPKFEHNHHSDSIFEVTAYEGVVYTASSDGTAVAADAETGDLIWQVDNHLGRELRSIDATDNLVVSGGFDNSVVAMNPSDGSIIWRHNHHYRNVYGVQIGNDGVVYSGAYDNHVRAASRESGKLLWSHAIQDSSVRDIKFTNQQVLSASWDGTVISVDNAIFYPFRKTEKSITFIDKHAPTDFSQQITYGVATDINGQKSKVRTIDSVNVPFTFSTSLGTVKPLTQSLDPRIYFFIQESPTTIGGQSVNINTFIPAQTGQLRAISAPELTTNEFIRFGKLKQELRSFTGIIEPDPIRPVYRANQLSRLIAPIGVEEKITTDFASATDKTTSVSGPTTLNNDFTLVKEENRKSFIDLVFPVRESVQSADELTLFTGPETKLSDFAPVSENPNTIFTPEKLETITTDTAQVKLNNKLFTNSFLKTLSTRAAAIEGPTTVTATNVSTVNEFLEASAVMSVVASGLIDYFDFNSETADISQLTLPLDVEYDSSAKVTEEKQLVLPQITKIDNIFVSASDIAFATAGTDTFVTIDLPFRALLSDVIAGAEVETLSENTTFSQLIDVSLQADQIEYMLNDTVPIQVRIPGDLNQVDNVEVQIEPVAAAGAPDIGGKGLIRNAQKGDVLYRFEPGETSVSGTYAISWRVEYNEFVSQTFPRNGPITFRINDIGIPRQ